MLNWKRVEKWRLQLTAAYTCTVNNQQMAKILIHYLITNIMNYFLLEKRKCSTHMTTQNQKDDGFFRFFGKPVIINQRRNYYQSFSEKNAIYMTKFVHFTFKIKKSTNPRWLLQYIINVNVIKFNFFTMAWFQIAILPLEIHDTYKP